MSLSSIFGCIACGKIRLPVYCDWGIISVMWWLFILLLSGCSDLPEHRGLTFTPNYSGQQLINDEIQNELRVLVEKNRGKHFMIHQPYYYEQLAELDNAKSHKQASKLAHFMRQQGVSADQISIQECQTCQNLYITYY